MNHGFADGSLRAELLTVAAGPGPEPGRKQPGQFLYRESGLNARRSSFRYPKKIHEKIISDWRYFGFSER